MAVVVAASVVDRLATKDVLGAHIGAVLHQQLGEGEVALQAGDMYGLHVILAPHRIHRMAGFQRGLRGSDVTR